GLGLAAVVHIGGVEEVPAAGAEGVEDAMALGLVGAEAPGGAKAHAAQTQLADPQATLSQELQFHRRSRCFVSFMVSATGRVIARTSPWPQRRGWWAGPGAAGT